MKDLKDIKVIAADAKQVKDILTQIGVEGSVVSTPSDAMAVGDRFKLTGIEKPSASGDDKFQPLVFRCSNGKSIGTKQFNSVVSMPAEAPKIGRTAAEAVQFLLYAQAAEMEFTVNSNSEQPQKELQDGRKYTPKKMALSVA